MNEKSNFYVFERKEIFLVILFVILVSITSFLFGLKMGSGYSFEKSGHNEADMEMISTPAKKIDFSSTEEESVKKMIDQQKAMPETNKEDINKTVEESLKKKMIEEFNSENSKKFNNEAEPVKVNEVAPETSPIVTEEVMAEAPATETVQENGVSSSDKFAGKYTIQLGSYQTVKEATDFAEGFKVLGYNPIINEVQIPNRGNWFRVSLGVFDSLVDAKNYLLKNKSLFSDRDYVLIQFD
ncbi:SPOR domain-containing protein [Bacteriovorax sp. Seq25_V]|uniref:SPOR domain-containing protein n=1 Tax=Bacteriovorax sp. Seq25_V TaxID=1201288 RepID=UPI00038A20A1|nr:SPOR domain-containing protein [Bacteriovorax sp. Seq25_V]EQC46688.1 sporulation and cell division repeat protein [Bacteriovorax sp. Seq25_V]